MRKFTLFCIAMAAASLMGCTKDTPLDDKPWEFEQYGDGSVHPGDNFYRYVSGNGLNGPGSDSWAMFGIWGGQEEDFTSKMYSPDGPIDVVARLLQLQNEPEEDYLAKAIPEARKRLAAIGNMKDISELPDELARLAGMGNMLITLRGQVVDGRAFVICPQATVMGMLDEVSPESLEKIGIDPEEYAHRFALAQEIDRIIMDKIARLGAESSSRLDADNPDDAMKLRAIINDSRAATRSGGGVAAKFGEAVGNRNPMFMPVDDVSIVFFDVMDELKDSDVDRANAYFWCIELAYEASVIFSRETIPPVFLPVLIPNLYMNANHYFCDNYVNVDNLQRNREVFEELRTSMAECLDRIDWMSSGTKAEAKKKIAAMEYSDGILDWSRYEATMPQAQDFCSAILELRAEYNRKTAAFSGEFYDLDNIIAIEYMAPLFSTEAYSANAFYIPSCNLMYVAPSSSIVMDMNKDFPLLAYVIGHEMCHGFDSEGSNYDEMGNLRNWWAIDDKLQFKAKQDQMVTIFNNYNVSGDIYCDGQKTLTENMADLGGVEITWHAAMKRLRLQYSGEALREMERRFFKSYAVMMTKYQSNDDRIKQATSADVHAIHEYRVNGIVNNIDAWYGAFDVTRGRQLWLSPENRVHLYL